MSRSLWLEQEGETPPTYKELKNMAKEINLENASADDFQILDESQIRYLYGGRYRSDDYIQVDGEDGKPKNMHKVTIELLCDHDQFLALMRASAGKEQINVKLV